MGYGLVNRFTGMLQTVTTINYDRFTDSRTLQTTAAMASNSAVSSALHLRHCPVANTPQLSTELDGPTVFF
jgi:hypothetical protein